jgi:catalase
VPGISPEKAAELVDSINAVSGEHPGFRAAHARGVVCAGSFRATRGAAALTRAAHMQGDQIKTTIRFSNGGGDPGIPDRAREARGMAVKFYLPDDSRTDIVSLTLPTFFVRTPDDFLEFTRLRRPDPETGEPDMQKLGEWFGRHPEAQQAIQATLAAGPPASYAQLEYNALHAFKWTDGSGEQRFVRYHWLPEAGVATLTEEEAKARPNHYLQDEIAERLEQGPAVFTLELELAEDGDDPDDPTAAWPDERARVPAGRLEITGLDTERERDGDVLVFDPTRVTDGIECSDDEILHARPPAYSVSVERRAGVPAP